jgi:hypothetical protein
LSLVPRALVVRGLTPSKRIEPPACIEHRVAAAVRRHLADLEARDAGAQRLRPLAE